MKFYKRKSFYIILIIIAGAGYFGYKQYQKSHQPPMYETVKVKRGEIKQTVEATGKIESLNEVSLRFEINGVADTINVKEGDSVKAGALLATLKLADLNAAVAQAEANLNQKLAGATSQDIAYYQAALTSAKAALQEAEMDADPNLPASGVGGGSRIVSSVYESTVPLLSSSLTKIDDALTQADNILGIDNVFANTDFRTSLSVLDSSQYTLAQSYFVMAKNDIKSAHNLAGSLSISSSRAKIDTGLAGVAEALSSVGRLLAQVSATLRATPAGGALPQATLDAKKTIIETARSGVATAFAAAVAQKQTIADAKSSVEVKRAAYNQALASFESKTVAPREVDVAYYRAALQAALANREKAILRAPIDGVVTKVNIKKGESTSVSDAAIQMLSPHYEVKVDIPETDIPKLHLKDQAQITLDAFGSDTKFGGTIIAIDPASTDIQDVVYYKITVALGETEQSIKAGMTANVSAATDFRSSTLYIPLRTVRSKTDGTKYVRLLNSGVESEAVVQLGLKANDGQVEVLFGLSEGQDVVVSVTK